MSEERRKYYRMPVDHLLEFREYSLSEGQDNLKMNNLKNISGGGVLFESDSFLSIGTLLKMKLKIPGWQKYKTEFLKHDRVSTTEPLVALGHVVRVEEMEDGKDYEIGVVFECVDDDHRNALIKYIEELKESEI